ncbi:MAG: GNAT family N-acetyltransferase [Pseudomonadota bacterium]
MSVTVREASGPDDLNAVRRLCWAYRDHLITHSPEQRDIIELFYPEHAYSDLMARLEQEHARPDGIILLAEKDGAPVGCGMSHRLSPTAVELKRIYVDDSARGTGLGRALCEGLIAQARQDGYQTVLLDTSRNLHSARALYAALGFQERSPYQPVPEIALPLLCFYEMAL